MLKIITTLSIALFLSACATGQPATSSMLDCKHHCEQSRCERGEKCTCQDCKNMDMTGKICPNRGQMSTPDKL